jgi:hypothetical protein
MLDGDPAVPPTTGATVKYMLLIYTPPMTDASDSACTPPAVEEWMLFDKTIKDAGVVVSDAALQDPTVATTVRVGNGGERTVTDGPFAETRELIGGFYVVDVPNLDVALDWAARCPGSQAGGTIEVRPVADFEQG